MATYKVTAPDGKTLTLTGPDGASQDEILAQAQKLYQPTATPPAPTDGVDHAARADALQAESNQIKNNPLQNENPAELFMAGVGKMGADKIAALHQLGVRAFGTPERLAELQAQQAKDNEVNSAITDTKSGAAGDLAANIAALAIPGTGAVRAGMTLPKLLALEAATGAASGATVPTTGEGQLPSNMETNAALNAAIPVGGAVLRKAVGETQPLREAAAQRLKDMGIDVSAIQRAPGAVSDLSSAVLQQVPFIGGKIRAGVEAQRDQAREVLFKKLLGQDAVPQDSKALAGVVNNIGEDIGAISKGHDAVTAVLPAQVDARMADYMNLPPSARSSVVENWAQDIKDLASKGEKLSGDTYAKIRSSIGSAASATKNSADKNALYDLQGILDKSFDAGLSDTEKASLQDARARYRLALQLNKQVIDPKKGLDLSQARSDVVRASKKGAIMPEATQLLDDMALVVPKQREPSQFIQGGTAVGAVANPGLALKSLGVFGVPHLALQTGVPQKLANDPTSRAAFANMLRGYIAQKQE